MDRITPITPISPPARGRPAMADLKAGAEDVDQRNQRCDYIHVYQDLVSGAEIFAQLGKQQ